MSKVVSKRYALALFQVAQANNAVASIGEELRTVKEVVESNPSFVQTLKHPKFSLQQKQAFIAEAFAGFNASILNTLNLLVERHRLNSIVDVVESFLHLANDAEGVAEATVYSVRPLTAEETASVQATFAAKVGKQSLRIENIIEPSLLGGVKVRIGNQIFDGSLSNTLHQLEKKLVAKS